MAYNKKVLPYLALGFSVAVLGFSAIFVRLADAPGPVMAFYRLGIATAVLTPIFFYKKGKSGLQLANWKVLTIPAIGGFMTAMDHTIWSSGMEYTNAANATLLNYAAPVWVALVAWIVYKEKLPRLFWFGLAFTFLGAGIVLGSDFLTHPTMGKGDLLALVSSFFYTGYFLSTQSGRKYFDTLSYVWLVGVASTITLVIVNLVMGLPLTGYSTQAYWSFLGAALLSQLGGYLSVVYALGHLPASIVSPTLMGQPVLTALLAVPILGEMLSVPQIIGGVIVIFGIFWVHKSRQRVVMVEK